MSMESTRLDFTRSSHLWSEKPGNWDKLNLRRVYPSSNPWGIPDTQSTMVRMPARLIAYNDRYGTQNPKTGDCIHFFLDDYRFETMWTLPEKSISRVKRVGMALSPDFSLWSDMPLIMQQWQVYRSRWCAAWMTEHGVAVIPTVTWGDERSFDFAFAGIPSGATVAISTVGVANSVTFRAGLHALVDMVSPGRILVYGGKRQLMKGCSGEVVYYDTRWKER